MSFDALGRYAPSHKTWDHVGNMIPVVEHSEGVRPHGEFRPAAWLPVQFFDKYYEEFYVVMPGKILACDNQGRIVPCQYGLAGADVTYTATDAEAGVIDVRTGETLLLAAVGTFSVGSVSNFMGTGESMDVRGPIGVAPYAYWQWGGDGSELDTGFNPAGFRQHNHNLQHRVAILCDYVLELPLTPAQTAAETISEDSFDGATNRSTFNALSNLPVAQNTQRTPFVFVDGTEVDSATRFVNEVGSIAEVLASGDFTVDLDTGIITVFATGSISGNYLLTYSNYASAPTGSNVSRFASALGDLKCGDFLVCNADSNWVLAAGSDDFRDIMGQVLEVEDQLNEVNLGAVGKDALGKVRTAYDPAINTDATGSLPGTTGQLDQMPGSATGGVGDKIHYAGAANLVVRINMISR